MGDFDRKQLDQLTAIGEYLQHIRQDQGRSLDDISAKTFIPLRILRALEGGQGGVLPEAVFVQGFIRRYADALGLDGISLSRSFPIEREPINFDNSEREQAKATQTLVETRIADSPKPDRRKRYVARDANSSSFQGDRRSQPSLPLIIAGLLLVGGLAYGLSRLFFTPQRSQPAITAAPATSPAPAQSPSPASPSPASPAASSPAASPSATATGNSAAANNSPVRVAMNVTSDAWVQVVADGRVAYEGTLTRGTQRNWSAKEELTIVSGNAGGVSLSYNGGAAKAMGAAGTVEEVTFTPNGNSARPN